MSKSDDAQTLESRALNTLMRAGVGRQDRTPWTNESLAGQISETVKCSAALVSSWRNGTPIRQKYQDRLITVLLPDVSVQRRFQHEHDVLTGFYSRQSSVSSAEPIYSKRDVWNFLLQPIQANVDRLVVESGSGMGGGMEVSDISSAPVIKRFHVPVPNWFADWANTHDEAGRTPYDVYPPMDLEGNSTLSHLLRLDHSNVLEDSIAKHAEQYAAFVKAKHTDETEVFPPYNKPKIGLSGWSQPVPANREERAHLTLRCYETDYFTHRVMRSVMKDMRQLHPEWFNDLSRYPETDGVFLPYFTTSVGINIVTVTRDSDMRRFQLSATTTNTGNLNQQSKWHISANEGLNTDDVFASTRRITFEDWVRRTLNEELGVLPDMEPDPIESIVFPEFSFEMTNFEPFLSCLVHLNMTSEELLKALRTNARDGRREIAALESHPFTANGVIDILLHRNADTSRFTSYALLILDLFMERGLVSD